MALSPQQEEQAILSGQEITPIGAPATTAKLLADTEVAFQQLGQWQLTWRRFRRHKFALVGAVTLILLGLMAIFAPLISPETYLNWNYLNASNLPPRLVAPFTQGWRYIMGSDAQGHSLLMWITYGARVSLMVGIISAAISSVIGVVLGGTAGYFGGWIDAVLMRITDIFLTLPFLPLLIMLSFYLSNGNATVIIIIFGVLTWPVAARLIRSYYLSFRQQEFTEAARAVGVSDARIIFRHILPNALSPVVVVTTLNVAVFISSEAAIDFLGVGIKPPTVSWGLALANSQDYFGVGNWWWAFFPGVFLTITVLAMNFLGDGLRDALDVRARGE